MNQSILYLRVSRDEQVRGTSLDSQEESARALSERFGYVVAAAYREEGKSGAHYRTRTKLQEALSHVEALRREGHGVALIFARLDRAARDVGAHQEIERRLSACGEIGPALSDEAIPMQQRAAWVRRLVQSVVPFETGEQATDARRNPLPGAVVTLVSPDSVGSLVIRATLSGDSVAVGEVVGG